LVSNIYTEKCLFGFIPQKTGGKGMDDSLWAYYRWRGANDMGVYENLKRKVASRESRSLTHEEKIERIKGMEAFMPRHFFPLLGFFREAGTSRVDRFFDRVATLFREADEAKQIRKVRGKLKNLVEESR